MTILFLPEQKEKLKVSLKKAKHIEMPKRKGQIKINKRHTKRTHSHLQQQQQE